MGECPVSRLVEMFIRKEVCEKSQYCAGRQTFEQASHHSRKYALDVLVRNREGRNAGGGQHHHDFHMSFRIKNIKTVCQITMKDFFERALIKTSTLKN